MRVFIYVNTNTTQKHITIHCESKKPCPHIMQQILRANAIVSCKISSLTQNKSIIKIGETENSFWLLMYANCCDDSFLRTFLDNVEIQNQVLTGYGFNPTTDITFCDKCS